MILAITGSRTFTDANKINTELMGVHNKRSIDVLFSSGCRDGADALCTEWAFNNGIQIVSVPAPWKQGKRAGFDRNLFMLELAMSLATGTQQALRLVAFAEQCTLQRCTLPRPHFTHGTRNCIGHARKLGIPIKVIKAHDND